MIHRIVYRRGMVDDPSDWNALETTVLKGPDLPLEVVESVLDSDLLTAGDVYGMPEAGERV